MTSVDIFALVCAFCVTVIIFGAAVLQWYEYMKEEK